MSDRDAWHKRQYDLVRADHPDIPTWEELTDERRQNVRSANLEHQKFMALTAAAIATGGPLPDPF